MSPREVTSIRALRGGRLGGRVRRTKFDRQGRLKARGRGGGGPRVFSGESNTTRNVLLIVGALAWQGAAIDAVSLPSQIIPSPLAVLAKAGHLLGTALDYAGKGVNYGSEKLDQGNDKLVAIGSDNNETPTATTVVTSTTLSTQNTNTGSTGSIASTLPATGSTVPAVNPNAAQTVPPPLTTIATPPSASQTPATTTAPAQEHFFVSGRIYCEGEETVTFEQSDKYVFRAMERHTQERLANDGLGTGERLAHISDVNNDATNFFNDWVAQKLDGIVPQFGQTFESPVDCVIPADLQLP